MRILSFVFLFIFAVNISAQSANVDDLFAQGMRQVNAGRFDDALTTYKIALATAENKYAGKEYLARLHYNIGLCYFHLDRFDEAANEMKSALLLKTDFVRAHEALEIFSKAKEQTPKFDSKTAKVD